MEIKKKSENLVELIFKSQKDQVTSLSRLGLYYEDPLFYKKELSLEEIKKKNRPVLNYMGFNFSSDQILNFINNSKINTVESKLLDTLNNKMETKDYYIITYTKNDTGTYEHEMAHYEYWNDTKIQNKIEKIVKKYETLQKNIIKLGYHESVINTEIYAFSKVIDTTLPISIKKDLFSIREHF